MERWPSPTSAAGFEIFYLEKHGLSKRQILPNFSVSRLGDQPPDPNMRESRNKSIKYDIYTNMCRNFRNRITNSSLRRKRNLNLGGDANRSNRKKKETDVFFVSFKLSLPNIYIQISILIELDALPLVLKYF